MRDTLTQYQIAGASLALAREGRLVLARGYGMADVERREPARPDALFCIASVTKPVTSAALTNLVSDCKPT
jgi:CubicO group peptidase (beta-lactamase class C family)